MKKTFLSLFNLSIRGVNLASKFILIIFLAKLLDTQELGLYGIIVATINFAMYFIGLDFYVYSNRELLKCRDSEKNKIITSHTQLLALVYFCTLPIISVIFFKDIIPIVYILPFYFLIILEHLNQELMRLLIVLKKPITANTLFFIRSGGWVFIIIALTWFKFKFNLLNVLNIWVVAEILCFVISLFIIYKKNIRFNIFQSINWQWITKGLKICIPFIVGTLAVRAIFTGDRYILEHFADKNILAAYVFFASLAAATLSFIDAAVFSFEYPDLVRSIDQKDNRHQDIIKKLYIKTISLLFVINIFAYILIKFLLQIVGKEIFYTYINYFYYLMFVQALYCMSMIPHYILYALNKDKSIIVSQISAFVIFLSIALILLSDMHSIDGLFIALVVSFVYILAYKFIYARKFLRQYEYSHSC